MKKYLNDDLVKILISFVLFILSFFLKGNIYLIITILSYIIISYEMIIKAFKNIIKKELFDENFLMLIATIGAFAIGEYKEAIVIMLLFKIGEYLSDLAVNNSKEKIVALLDYRSDYTNLYIADDVVKVKTKTIKLDDIFMVFPGEKVPLDGIIIEGETTVDTKALTGESIPRLVKEEDEVLSGFINQTSIIKVKATTTYTTSTASKIIKMIEELDTSKTKTEKFITKFSKVYTPIVVIAAILIAIIPLLFSNELNIYNSLVFLVASCPCALVISVPLGYFSAIGRASKEGILIKSSNSVDLLTKINTLVLDKTGTITHGNFKVIKVKSISKITEDELLKIAAHLEYYSKHPIANSIVLKYGKNVEEKLLKNYKEIAGKGIEASYNNHKYYIGSSNFIKEKYDISNVEEYGTVCYIANDKKYLGYIVIADEIKKDSKEAIGLLKKNIDNIVLISGDNKNTVKQVSKVVGIANYHYGMLPQEKAEKVIAMKEKYITAFVGDGLNDALVIKTADLGISMGNIGSDAAIEASDVVLMYDKLTDLSKGINLAKRSQRIIKANIIFSILTKFIVLLLGIFGMTSIWLAVFADVGVTLISVLNSLRIMKVKL